jgi:tRNA-2-methylthio-N6-dimethylallyladenosine synthase
MIGRNVQVLFDRKGRFNNQLVGKSEYLHAVNVTDPTIAVGELKNVYITKSNTNSLSGSVLN